MVLGVRAPPGGDVRRQFEVSLTPHVSPSGAPSRRPWVGAAPERWGDKVQVGGLANGHALGSSLSPRQAYPPTTTMHAGSAGAAGWGACPVSTLDGPAAPIGLPRCHSTPWVCTNGRDSGP